MSEEGPGATGIALQFDDAAQRSSAAKLGMWTFLATEVLFFGVLFVSYMAGRVMHLDAFKQASKHTDVVLGTIETCVLLSSSFTMALAARAVELGTVRPARRLLGLTAMLGLAFLGIHAKEYIDEFGEHLVPGLGFEFPGSESTGAELFFLLYYITTGFHGLHVTIGIAVIAGVALRIGRPGAEVVRRDVAETAALYWHLVDIVWVWVFPLFYLVSRV